MTPRNTNQVSEANVSRYISSTVIAPFGYTGIPILVNMAHRNKYAIMTAIIGYTKVVNRLSCHFSDGSITASVLELADYKGAIYPIVRHSRDTELNRIFTLEYNIPNYPPRQTFGFAVKQK